MISLMMITWNKNKNCIHPNHLFRSLMQFYTSIHHILQPDFYLNLICIPVPCKVFHDIDFHFSNLIQKIWLCNESKCRSIFNRRQMCTIQQIEYKLNTKKNICIILTNQFLMKVIRLTRKRQLVRTIYHFFAFLHSQNLICI